MTAAWWILANSSCGPNQPLPEFPGKMLRPRDATGRILAALAEPGHDHLPVRFVGEDAGDTAAEVFTDFTAVGFEGGFEELRSHAGIEQIDVGPIPVPG